MAQRTNGGGFTRDQFTDGFLDLVPPEIATDIIRQVGHISAAMALGRQRRMSTRELILPVIDALPSASWLNPANGGGNGHVFEGDEARKPSSNVFGLTGFNIVAEEMAVIVRAPENLLDDMDFDLWAEVRPAIESSIAQKLDLAVFYGVEAPQNFFQGGLLQACQDHGSVMPYPSAAPDFAGGVSDLMSMVEEDGYETNGFAVAPRVRGVLRNLRDDSGAPIFTPSIREGEGNLLWGERLFYLRGLDAWNHGPVFTGDWSNLIIAIRQDIRWKVLDQAVVDGVSLAETDQVALRCTFRVGWTAINPPTGDNPDNETRFPFAAMEAEGGETRQGRQGQAQPRQRRQSQPAGATP